jgi:hypothetical protein
VPVVVPRNASAGAMTLALGDMEIPLDCEGALLLNAIGTRNLELPDSASLLWTKDQPARLAVTTSVMANAVERRFSPTISVFEMPRRYGCPPSAFVKIEFLRAARPLPPNYPQRKSKLSELGRPCLQYNRNWQGGKLSR